MMLVTGIVGSEDAYIPYSSAAQYYIGNVATSSSIGFYQLNYPSQVRNCRKWCQSKFLQSRRRYHNVRFRHG